MYVLIFSLLYNGFHSSFLHLQPFRKDDMTQILHNICVELLFPQCEGRYRIAEYDQHVSDVVEMVVQRV